ncbi:LysM peptidoglycan-binding domain-containing protein [Simiduia curdlanivorans]|uniref:LysM peptidoglycan-binding domain-containing protein n=4 Tax=Simiduia curdlanivorans TaxID=1492769 RepID=A0ABV8V4N2_9GAMM
MTAAALVDDGSVARTYAFDDVNILDVASIKISGLTKVKAGSSDADTVNGIGEWTMLGSNNSAHNNGIDFEDIEFANSALTTLKGSAAADIVDVLAANSIEAWDITFNVAGGGNFSAIDLGTDTGDTVTGIGASDWTDIAANSATNSGIQFIGLDAANTDAAILTGSALDDEFTDVSGSSVTFQGIKFSKNSGEFEKVLGGGSTTGDTLFAGAAAVTLVSDENAVLWGNTLFEDLAAVQVGSIFGSTGVDQFIITGNQALVVKSIQFTGVSEVDGGDLAGGDSVSGGASWTLDWDDLDPSIAIAESQNIRFSHIGSAQGSSRVLVGSGGADIFSINGNIITANDIDFTVVGGESFLSVDALGGEDSASGADGFSWSLIGNKHAVYNTTEFFGFEALSGAATSAFMSADDDIVNVIAPNKISAYNMTLESSAAAGLSRVDMLGGDDVVGARDGQTFELLAEDKSVITDGITFLSVERVENGNIIGGEAGINFIIDVDGKVTAGGLDVTNANGISGGSGYDTVTSENDEAWTILGSNSARNMAQIFTDIEYIVSRSAEIFGSALGDTFSLLSNGNLRANNMDVKFQNGLHALHAGSGADVFTGFSETQYSLTDEVGRLSIDALSLAISSVETINGGHLIGSEQSEIFVVQGLGNVRVNQMDFNNLISLTAGESVLDADEVISLAGAQWETLNAAQSEHAGIVFSGLEKVSGDFDTLIGTVDDDLFSIDAAGVSHNGVLYSSSAVAGLATVDGMGGQDTLIVDDSYGFQLTSVSGQGKVSESTFSRIELVDAKTVLADASGSSVAINGNNQITVSDMTVSGATQFFGSNVFDSVSGGSAWQLLNTPGVAIADGIEFSAIERVETSANVISSVADSNTVSVTDAAHFRLQDIDFTSLAVSGFSQLNLGVGANEVSADNVKLENSDQSIWVETLLISGVDKVLATNLSGTESDDSFTVLENSNIAARLIEFEGLVSINGAGGQDSIANAGAVVLLGGTQFTAADYNLDSVEFIQADTLIGSTGVENYVLFENGEIGVSGLTFSGLASVASGGGEDAVQAPVNSTWLIDGNEKLTNSGVEFTGMRFASGAEKLFSTGDSDETYELIAGNSLRLGGVSFSGLSELDAGLGQDQLIGADGQVWQLLGSGEFESGGVNFKQVELVTATDAGLIHATGVAELFDVSAEGALLSVAGVDFSGVTRLIAGSEDALSLSAGQSLALTNAFGQVQIASLLATGMSDVSGQALVLSGTDVEDEFQLGINANTLAVAGVNFAGVSEILAGTGSDRIIGTVGADQFDLSAAGDIAAAGMVFTGVTQVDGAGGSDLVMNEGAEWRALVIEGELAERTALANLGSVSVLFTNLESVNNTGRFNGAALSGEYVFTDVNQLQYAGMTFNGLNYLQANGAADTLVGADVDLSWNLISGSSSFSNEASSVSFAGIDALQLGAGSDSVVVNGASLTAMHTGGGDDSVSLQTGGLQTLDLGVGDDRLDILSHEFAPASLSGGLGNDTLASGVAGLGWDLAATAEGESGLGNYVFAQFEALLDSSENLQVESLADTQLTGTGLMTGGMSLEFSNANTLALTVNSSSESAVSGDVSVSDVSITSAGDVNIYTDVDLISIDTQSTGIDIALVVKDDIKINSINAGSGDIDLASEGIGNLSVVENKVNFTAANLVLGTNTEPFLAIGDQFAPVTMNVSQSVNFVGLSFVEPLYVGVVPVTSSFTGDRIESVYGEQAGQGVKSAVQTAVEDFSQVDPAIFEAVSPYSASADAVATGEYRLVAGVLLPVDATAAGAETDEEEGKKKPADEAESNAVTPILFPEEAALPELKPGYSESYHIKEGDTLWDIAEKFLKDPYKWIELWQQNPKVKNPNLIYPGDVIKVIIINGKAFLTIRFEPLPEQKDPVIALASSGFGGLDTNLVAPAI